MTASIPQFAAPSIEPLASFNTVFSTLAAARDRLNQRLSETAHNLPPYVFGRVLEHRSELLKGLAIRRAVRRYHPALAQCSGSAAGAHSKAA